jgi:hypothetical protein
VKRVVSILAVLLGVLVAVLAAGADLNDGGGL